MQLPFQYVSASLSMAYAFVCALPCPPAFQKVALWCNIYLVLDSSIVRGGAYLIVSLLADSAARRSQIIRCRLLLLEARDAHMIGRFLISPHESLAAAQSHPRPLLRPSLSKRAFVRVVECIWEAIQWHCATVRNANRVSNLGPGKSEFLGQILPKKVNKLQSLP